MSRDRIEAQQPRLTLGELQLVAVEPPAPGRATVWALPGGGRATTDELLALARRNGWKRPRAIEVRVHYRAGDGDVS